MRHELIRKVHCHQTNRVCLLYSGIIVLFSNQCFFILLFLPLTRPLSPSHLT